MRRSVLIGGSLALALLGAGCGSSSNSSKGGSNGAETVKLTITDGGCQPSTLALTPGPKNFEISNNGASSITELELKSGDHIVGESENLTPGLSGKFSVTLKPGTYEASCPGGKSGTITVSGTPATTAAPSGSGAGSATNTAAAATAVAAYRSYLEDQMNQLVDGTTSFTEAINEGDVEMAKQLYAGARSPYESIEPVAESFGDLDAAIDAREGDVPAAQWGGFHRIEKQLFVNGNLDGMKPVAAKLLADVKTLQAKIPTLDLEPAQIANGAVELMNEVGKSKITGEEDRYSHTDLSDFAANVYGAQEAINTLRPLIAAKNPGLVGTIAAQFAAVTSALNRYKTSDGNYVSYTKLTEADTKALGEKVDALADQLADVPPLVVTS